MKNWLKILKDYVDEVESLLKNATYGLSALQTLINAIPTTPELEADAQTRYNDLKGYVDEIESLLKNATYGLEALDTDLNTIIGYVDEVESLLRGQEISGTIVLQPGTSEQDVLEVTPAKLQKYEVLLLDLNELTQNTTIRIYIKIDGTNYRLINSAVYPTDFPTNAKGVPIELYSMSVPWKITLQSAVSEGVARNIPYRYVVRNLE